jgi:hypothetical protein
VLDFVSGVALAVFAVNLFMGFTALFDIMDYQSMQES